MSCEPEQNTIRRPSTRRIANNIEFMRTCFVADSFNVHGLMHSRYCCDQFSQELDPAAASMHACRLVDVGASLMWRRRDSGRVQCRLPFEYR